MTALPCDPPSTLLSPPSSPAESKHSPSPAGAPLRPDDAHQTEPPWALFWIMAEAPACLWTSPHLRWELWWRGPQAKGRGPRPTQPCVATSSCGRLRGFPDSVLGARQEAIQLDSLHLEGHILRPEGPHPPLPRDGIPQEGLG